MVRRTLLALFLAFPLLAASQTQHKPAAAPAPKPAEDTQVYRNAAFGSTEACVESECATAATRCPATGGDTSFGGPCRGEGECGRVCAAKRRATSCASASTTWAAV